MAWICTLRPSKKFFYPVSHGANEKRASIEGDGYRKFITDYREFITELDKTEVAGIGRTHAISLWLSRYNNKEFFRNQSPTVFKAEVEPDITPYNGMLEEVLDFCLVYGMPAKLNMSFMEILNSFDLPTYTLIKEKIMKHVKSESDGVEEIKKQLKQRRQR